MVRSDPEAELIKAYRAQAQQYARAVQIAQGLSRALEQTENDELALRELHEALNETSRIDSSIESLKESWQGEKRKPGAELAAALDHVAGLMHQLIQEFRLCEKAAKEQMGVLSPQLDDEIRRQRMQRAYGSR